MYLGSNYTTGKDFHIVSDSDYPYRLLRLHPGKKAPDLGGEGKKVKGKEVTRGGKEGQEQEEAGAVDKATLKERAKQFFAEKHNAIVDKTKALLEKLKK